MSDASSNELPELQQEPPATLSAETVLAVRQYHQQVASYTLRQWTVAKLESERKERERRKRRADYLQQQQQKQQQQQSANAVPTVRPSVSNAGSHGPRPSSEPIRPNGDGPLMMVSKRRTDRALSGGSSVPSTGPAQSTSRHSHDQRYASQQSQSYDIHADIASVADQHRQQQPAAQQPQQQQRPRRHQRSSHADHSALHPISPILAASSIVIERPRAKHMGSGVTGLTTSAVGIDDDDRPLTPPLNLAWQRHSSGSTPPIAIPRQSVTAVSTPTGSAASSGGSSSASRSAPGARALGFAAHLGMTSISTGGPSSTSALTDSMSTGTSTSSSGPTSEGSSRMSSFSDHHGMPGIRTSLKKSASSTKEANLPRSIDDHHVRPVRPHRTSLGATVSHRAPCAVEGAIGTLRRMTVSGDETGVFGALDEH